MATITEDYVSFEIAKLLKEKEFLKDKDLRITQNLSFYDNIGLHHNLNKYYNSLILDKIDFVVASTHQMVMKWLRETHHIHIEICLYKTSEDDIEPKKSRKAPYYTFGVWNTITGDNIDKRLTNDFIGDTYEEAVEAALEYTLKNLI